MLFIQIQYIMPKLSRPQSCTQCPYQYKYLNLLGNNKIKDIQNNCMIINFKKGENIIKQGTDVTHAFYLAKGLLCSSPKKTTSAF